jgi:Ca2+:H+ antiporter
VDLLTGTQQVSIQALRKGQIEVVQSSMLGSILSNLLLVMGMCFFFGGLVHRGTSGNGSEQVFSSAVAQATCSLMTLASATLILPAAVSFFVWLGLRWMLI